MPPNVLRSPGGVFAHVGLGQNDGAGSAQPRHDGGIARRPVVGIVGGSAAGRAHVEGVELVLDGEHDAVQRPLETAGAGELLVERPRGLERVRHRRIVVDSVGLRPLAADVERHQGADLAGFLDRLDVAEHVAVGVRGAGDALAVIGRDALEVEADELGRGELLRQDRAMDVGDRRLLQVEVGKRGERPCGEHGGNHNGGDR